MSAGTDAELNASDQKLVERTRSGDQAAFAELWRRHYRAGARVARQFTSSIDADDLVSEAYTRIYQLVVVGGGPTGAFRPYLYTTIRNLASTWGARSKDVQVDDIADFEDPDTIDDPVAVALDRTLTARAFRSLPDRWQSVLWYTEVEGMDPHEVAPILGMTANGVAALSYRAREGLRKAWLQAHITSASALGECHWVLSRIGDHARHSLTSRDDERMARHLATCSRCSIVSEEVDEVGSRLALVMLPILLGGVVGGAMMATFGQAGSAMAAAETIPALPEAIELGATAASGGVGVLGLIGSASAPVALAVAVALGGAIAVTWSDQNSDDTPPSSTDANRERPPVEEPIAEITPDATSLPPVDPSSVDGVVDSLVGTLTGEESVASVSLSVSGTGTPGAKLSLQALGQVYASATVDANGHYSIGASGIPGGLSSLDLVQTVDKGYLSARHVVDALIRPLELSSNSSAVSINLVG